MIANALSFLLVPTMVSLPVPPLSDEPTVLMGCTPDMDVMTKEIFGPVLPMQVVGDLDEAIALANDSDFGLTSSIFTGDLNAAMKAS